jgi:hypothetical protein
MSAPPTGFTHIVLWMNESAWPLQSQIVPADEVRQGEDRVTLLREGRLVFQLRSGDVARVEPHVSLHAAQRAFDEHRAIRGRGGLRVVELAPPKGAPGPGATISRGAPAEGIGFRIIEDG